MGAPGHVLHVLVVLLHGVIPYVPLVKGKVDVLFAMLGRLDVVAGCDDGLEEILQIIRNCEELRRIVVRIAPVLVE